MSDARETAPVSRKVAKTEARETAVVCLLEMVLGVLCDDKSRMLLVPAKRGFMLMRVSTTMLRLARSGPWPVYVQAKARGEIPKGPGAALSVCRHIPTEDQHPWLYVLHALKKLSKHTLITGLDLSRMGKCTLVWPERELPPLVKAHSKWLEVLNLSGLEMDCDLYYLFTEGPSPRDTSLGPLSQCTSLTHLDLSGPFGVGEEGMIHLSKVLPKLTSLRTLVLRDGIIGDKGLELLAATLHNCPWVSFVNARGNRAPDDGLAQEGKALLRAAFETRPAHHRLLV